MLSLMLVDPKAKVRKFNLAQPRVRPVLRVIQPQRKKVGEPDLLCGIISLSSKMMKVKQKLNATTVVLTILLILREIEPTHFGPTLVVVKNIILLVVILSKLK